MISLQDQLDEITANTRHLVQAERLAVGERAVEELFSTGIEDHILPVGSVAPEFALKDSNGKLVRSADMLALGPLVIKFFRGRWCSYCVPVLTDLGCALAEQFGLVYTVPEYHQHYYRSILVNVPFVNGEPSWRLPLPATYVISRERKVLFAEAHADFRVRPEPEEALAAALATHSR